MIISFTIDQIIKILKNVFTPWEYKIFNSNCDLKKQCLKNNILKML